MPPVAVQDGEFGRQFLSTACLNAPRETARTFLRRPPSRSRDWLSARARIMEQHVRGWRIERSEAWDQGQCCVLSLGMNGAIRSSDLQLVATSTEALRFEQHFRRWRPPIPFSRANRGSLVGIFEDMFVGPVQRDPDRSIGSYTSVFSATQFLDDGRQNRPARFGSSHSASRSAQIVRLEGAPVMTTNWPLNMIENYYHFVRETLACVVKMKLLLDELPGAQLLVPFGSRVSVPWRYYELLFAPDQLKRLLLPFDKRKTYSIQKLVWVAPPAVRIAPLDARLLRRAIVRSQAVTRPIRRDLVLVIDRGQAESRQLTNHKELVEAVRAVAGSLRVRSIGAMPVHEQVHVFRRAALVVAPHGAGEVNLLWADPATPLIEVGPWSGPERGGEISFNTCFWDLCSQRGTPFFYVPVFAGARSSDAFTIARLRAPLRDVQQTVKRALLAHGRAAQSKATPELSREQHMQ